MNRIVSVCALTAVAASTNGSPMDGAQQYHAATEGGPHLPHGDSYVETFSTYCPLGMYPT